MPMPDAAASIAASAVVTLRRGATRTGFPANAHCHAVPPPNCMTSCAERAARPRQKTLARVGEAHGARGAIEQAHAEPRFEIGHGAGDCGRRAVQPARGGREAALPGHLGKDLDVLDAIHIIPNIEITTC